VGIPPQEDVFIGLATERMFLAPIKMTMIPEIVDMHMPMQGVFHNIVLNSINNTFSGQPMKVMNALWGAGQMMFNKYLAVFDKDINLSDYELVIDEFLKNTHPIDDVLFSRGPMDVLDHASVKYAEGGKMGFDATSKNVENKKPIIDSQQIINIEGVVEINMDFVNRGLGLLLIRVRKSKNVARKVAKKMYDSSIFENIKFVVFIEEVAVLSDFGDVIWRLANNSDPNRDCFYVYDNNLEKKPTLFIDGLRKDLASDNFQRQWPNIVCSDEATIELVNNRWAEYDIGEFLPSPSIKYRKQLYGGGAVAE
jgi:4-hydroxy-3-polyprenylbenzoate decarboxylase